MTFKKFTILDEFSKPLMATTNSKCLPSVTELTSMINAKYKFKVDSKMISKSNIKSVVHSLRKQDK